MWPQDKTMGHPFVTLREWGNGKMSNASVRFLYTNTCGTNRRNRRSVWNKQEEGEISAVTGLWPHCSYREGVEQLPWLECCHKWPHTAEEGWIRNTQSWIYPSQEAAALVVCWALSQGGWQERWEVMGQDQRAGWGGWHWSGCLLQAARAGGGREWELLQAPRNSLTVTPCFLWGDITNLTSTREAQTMQEIPGKHWWWLPITSGEGSHKEQCTPWLHINKQWGPFWSCEYGENLGCSDHEVVEISNGWGGKKGERL